MSGLDEFRADYDWREAFGFVGTPDTCAGGHSALEVRGGPAAKGTAQEFDIANVTEVLAACAGENDGAEWLAIVRCQNAFLFVAAGCDYTGWDCQAGGHGVWSLSLDDLWRWGVGEEHRQRLMDAGFDPLLCGVSLLARVAS